MFVRESRYNAMRARAGEAELMRDVYRAALSEKMQEWNALVTRINELGGEAFLKRGNVPNPLDFTAEDVQRLIQLCHPDKHDGKQSATDMTAKLLRLRERLAP